MHFSGDVEDAVPYRYGLSFLVMTMILPRQLTGLVGGGMPPPYGLKQNAEKSPPGFAGRALEFVEIVCYSLLGATRYGRRFPHFRG